MKTLKHLISSAALFVFFAVSFVKPVEARQKQSHLHTVSNAKHHHHHQQHHKRSRTELIKTGRDRQFTQQGLASWYGPGFHGRKTASGERFNMYAMTAAHRTLGLLGKVKVTNLKNNKTVVVKVNDRGPYVRRRILDLSKGAAMAIGLNGTGQVLIEAL